MQLARRLGNISGLVPSRQHSQPNLRLLTRAMATKIAPEAQSVLTFWLGEGWEDAPATDIRSERMPLWFQGNPDTDAEITSKFGASCEELICGDLDSWNEGGNALETLAGIIIGDQLCRNVYRGTAKMYAADPKVLAWAKSLVDSGRIKDLKPIQRVWVFMPYMHSEALSDQEQCVQLFKGLRDDGAAMEGGEAIVKVSSMNVSYAERHRDIVAKWGRFPHRNALVGRESTPEEKEGLENNSIERF